MNGLHDGQLRRVTLAGSAVALVASAFVFAPPAGAETIGGDLLASAHRTVQLGPDAKPLPDVWAESWILADAGIGEVLAQKASHARRPPASTLKTLTALTVLPRTSLDQRYAATPRAAGIYGARVGLRVGKAYTMEQLWHAVFLPSANDAAIAEKLDRIAFVPEIPDFAYDRHSQEGRRRGRGAPRAPPRATS